MSSCTAWQGHWPQTRCSVGGAHRTAPAWCLSGREAGRARPCSTTWHPSWAPSSFSRVRSFISFSSFLTSSNCPGSKGEYQTKLNQLQIGNFHIYHRICLTQVVSVFWTRYEYKHNISKLAISENVIVTLGVLSLWLHHLKLGSEEKKRMSLKTDSDFLISSVVSTYAHPSIVDEQFGFCGLCL